MSRPIFAALAHVIQPKDYLRLRLTGEIASDMSDAAGTWWLDEQARAWSIAALAASGVDPACAPRLVEGSDAVGGLRPAIADALGLPSADVGRRGRRRRRGRGDRPRRDRGRATRSSRSAPPRR